MLSLKIVNKLICIDCNVSPHVHTNYQLSLTSNIYQTNLAEHLTCVDTVIAVFANIGIAVPISRFPRHTQLKRLKL